MCLNISEYIWIHLTSECAWIYLNFTDLSLPSSPTPTPSILQDQALLCIPKQFFVWPSHNSKGCLKFLISVSSLLLSNVQSHERKAWVSRCSRLLRSVNSLGDVRRCLMPVYNIQSLYTSYKHTFNAVYRSTYIFELPEVLVPIH